MTAASLVGGASPAVAGSVVVSPYSSGEIIALQADNGRVLAACAISCPKSNVMSCPAFGLPNGLPNSLNARP